MIPNHISDDLGPEDRVAVLARRGELLFLVRGAADPADAIRAGTARDGSEVLATHLQDKAAILAFVAERKRDLGREGWGV